MPKTQCPICGEWRTRMKEHVNNMHSKYLDYEPPQPRPDRHPKDQDGIVSAALSSMALTSPRALELGQDTVTRSSKRRLPAEDLISTEERAVLLKRNKFSVKEDQENSPGSALIMSYRGTPITTDCLTHLFSSTEAKLFAAKTGDDREEAILINGDETYVREVVNNSPKAKKKGSKWVTSKEAEQNLSAILSFTYKNEWNSFFCKVGVPKIVRERFFTQIAHICLKRANRIVQGDQIAEELAQAELKNMDLVSRKSHKRP